MGKASEICVGIKGVADGTLVDPTIIGNPVNDDGTPANGSWRLRVNATTGNLEFVKYDQATTAWIVKQTIE